MAEERTNIVGLEGEDVSFETDVLAEERENAKANYQHLEREYAKIKAQVPYPDVKPFETTWLPGALSDLQYKKTQNQPYWAKMNAVKAYTTKGDLYSGHIRFNAGGDRYFMESPELATKEWYVDGHRVLLINVDDKTYKAEIDAWHYPDQHPSVAFSRNIAMQNRIVQSVDIILDRGDSMYASITDNYLRNALKRNKNKSGFQSIIQTIQRKQDDIRSLNKDSTFIVQGCAGSGKTMVLLHRLRYLVYNKDIYSEDYYFLVPSTGFKKYIKDITTKFHINYGNVMSYQGYYRFLLGKTDSALDDEVSELVFPAVYLSRVYSKSFMQECYRALFELIVDQTNGLNEFCEEKLNAIIDTEQRKIEKAIVKIKADALLSVKKRTASIVAHVDFELAEFDSIPKLIETLNELIEEHKAQLASPDVNDENIVIAPDDPRVLADKQLQQHNADVEAEEIRVKKASIFTVNSHRKKLQQLIEKRNVHYELLIHRITEDEKRVRAAEAAKLSLIFEGITIRDVEAALSESRTIYDDAVSALRKESDKQQNIMDIIAERYKTEISALTQMIEASAEIVDQIPFWVGGLVPIGDVGKAYIQKGMALYAAFIKHTTDKDEREAFQDKYKIFARRTDREQLAYLNTLLTNICRKTIKQEYDIKICDVYKHYWYISVYCNYLIYGNTQKYRPYIFIDEAQDLSPSEIELIRKLNTSVDDHGNRFMPVLNIFGDVNQTITTHGITNWDDLHLEGNIFTLDENFRNTNQIVDFCNTCFPFHMKKIGVDMDDVDEFISIEEAKRIAGIPEGTTFIVKDAYAAEDLIVALQRAHIQNCHIYTVKEAKGLEFKQVIVVDRGMSINEKYISYTRALAKLSIVHSMPSVSDPSETRIIQGDDSGES